MEVILHPEVKIDLQKLDSSLKKEVEHWLKRLEQNAYLGKELLRELKGARKLYLNNAKHRIVYIVNEKTIHILVIAIGARQDSEVYKVAKKRMQNYKK